MIEDFGGKRVGIAGAVGPSASLQVLPAIPCRVVLRREVPVRIESVRSQTFEHARRSGLKGFGRRRLVADSAALQFAFDCVPQRLVDEARDGVALVVQDPVDTEIEIGTVELEQFAQQPLELLKRAFGHGRQAREPIRAGRDNRERRSTRGG